MATYRIKQGESLKLRYAVDGIPDLTGYWCAMQIVREDAAGEDCNMALTDDNSAFEGNVPGSLTADLSPRMYILLVLIQNGDDEDSRRVEIHDKLIVEEGGLTVNPGA